MAFDPGRHDDITSVPLLPLTRFRIYVRFPCEARGGWVLFSSSSLFTFLPFCSGDWERLLELYVRVIAMEVARFFPECGLDVCAQVWDVHERWTLG